MKRLNLGRVVLELPGDWADATEDLGIPGAPFTLAKEAGVGALQLSPVLYKGGKKPAFTVNVLEHMLTCFVAEKTGAHPLDVVREEGVLRLVAGTFEVGADRVRAWYISDGTNLVFVTYLAESRYWPGELGECEVVVRKIAFDYSSDK
ncbi:MAG TPA: hypothetical protein PLS53_18230 [Thermoanaerobaculaceae bacterium]|nr:hypothetical protein [Thermoanaerobaculaceae bacterium]